MRQRRRSFTVSAALASVKLAAMTPDHTKVCFLKTNNTSRSTNVG